MVEFLLAFKKPINSCTRVYSYALFIVSIMISLCQCGHIYSWDISTKSDYSGRPTELSLVFKLESGVSSQEVVKIELPFSLGTNPYSSLLQEENNIQLAQSIYKDAASTGLIYFFKF